jgi:hypothetical protein
MMVKYGVTSLTTNRVHVETWLAVSLHQRNVAKGRIRMTKICMTSYAAELHTIRLTADVRSMRMLSKNDVMRQTMTTMDPSTTNLTNNAFLKEGTTHEESKLFPMI